jgi:hypothetical protein
LELPLDPKLAPARTGFRFGGRFGLVAFFALNNHAPRQDPAPEEDLIAQIDVQDYEVVADLDELLASDENNLWDENSSL